MSRPRKPLVDYIRPTAEETESGSVLQCETCERPWPLRLCVPSLRRCVNCARSWWREERDARQGHHWRAYGLSKRDVEQKLLEQGSGCAICQTPIYLGQHPRAQLDHDHSTGAARGFLCPRCNYAMGRFEDDPTLLRAAATYLAHHGSKITKPAKRPKQMRVVPKIPLRPRKRQDFVTRSGERIDLSDPTLIERLESDSELQVEIDAYIAARAQSGRPNRRREPPRPMPVMLPERAPSKIDLSEVRSEFGTSVSAEAEQAVDALLRARDATVIDVVDVTTVTKKKRRR